MLKQSPFLARCKPENCVLRRKIHIEAMDYISGESVFLCVWLERLSLTRFYPGGIMAHNAAED